MVLRQADNFIEEEAIVVPNDGTLDGRNSILTGIRPFIVNSCIHGVDINPHAVELAKIAIWMTTLDRRQPFKFLDHKLKVGNSLVGTWLAQLYDFPMNSFKRRVKEDKVAVHFKDLNKDVNKAIRREKKFAEDILKDVNIRLRSGQRGLFEENDSKNLLIISQKYNHLTRSRITLEKIEPFSTEDSLRMEYHEILEMPVYKKLKLACDWWISLWFLPMTDLDMKNSLTREDFKNSLKSPQLLLDLNNLREKLKDENKGDSLVRINEVVQSIHPFHWELEFPHIFLHQNPGFDLVIGNPPWERYISSSVEFFTNYDSIFRSLGNQEKLRTQEELYANDIRIEEEWLKYSNHYDFFTNYRKSYAGQTKNKTQYLKLNMDRESIILRDPAFFENQYKGHTNLYKLFLERFYHLAKNKGKVGIILHSGIYADDGSQDLRRMLFNQNEWKLLFTFINRKKIFPVHSSTKFAICIFKKGRETETIVTAFLRENMSDLKAKFEECKYIFLQSEFDVKVFSPENLRFLEITDRRDFEILRKLRENNGLVGSNYQGEWKIKYKTEFNATNSSKKFVDATSLLKQVENFGSDKILNTYGIIKNTKTSQIYLPVIEGKHIEIGKIRFRGHQDNKKDLQSYSWSLPSEHYMEYKIAHERIGSKDLKIVFRDITASSNTRSMISAIVPNFPAKHTLSVASQQTLNEETLLIVMFLQSFVYDYILRKFLSGSHVSLFIFKRTILPHLKNIKHKDVILPLIANLNLNAPIFSPFWKKYSYLLDTPIKYWALTEHEQLRLQVILNVISAYFYSLSVEEFSYILRYDPGDATGFFRVDKEKKGNDRLPYLCIEAYKKLKEQGLSLFLSSQYQLPEDMQDLLGARFLDWQIKMTEQEAWDAVNSYVSEFSQIF